MGGGTWGNVNLPPFWATSAWAELVIVASNSLGGDWTPAFPAFPGGQGKRSRWAGCVAVPQREAVFF